MNLAPQKMRKIYIIFSILSILALIGSLTITFTGRLSVVYPPTPNIAVKIEYYFGNYSWFFYFTDLSNSFFVIVTTMHIFYKKKAWINRLQSISCTYMILVGLGYWTLLAPSELAYFLKGNAPKLPGDFFIYFILNNLFLHLFNVILAGIILFKIITIGDTNIVRASWCSLIYPAIFYTFAWIIYLLTWKLSSENKPAYIYTFLNFFHPYGINNIYLVILADVALISLIFLLCYWIYYFSNKKRCNR